MNIVGMMRVKNEARWIRKSVESILRLCDRVVILDDHSTDGTLDVLCSMHYGGARLWVIASPFEGLQEARDKNFLLDKCTDADWIIAIDGDEVLTDIAPLARAMMRTDRGCLSLPILYAWDRPDQIRVDGVYGNFRRESVFRPDGSRFHETVMGPNFHCGNVPPKIRETRAYAEAPLLHFGYMEQDDRIRKYAWYNRNDPHNASEDCYRHMVQGDIPEVPADAKLKHAGPLAFRPL